MASATLRECFTEWSVTPNLGMHSAPQAILAHAAGENSPTNPGRVNRYNAGIIEELYKAFHIPVIVQGELAIACRERNIPLTAVSKRQAELVAPNYLDSRDMAIWQKGECDKIGATRVVLVSYYPHYWRALKCTEKVGLTVLTPLRLRRMFDWRNSQWWAKFGAINQPYELAARLEFYKNGWI